MTILDIVNIFKEPAPMPILSSSSDVRLNICLWLCPLPMRFCLRPLIGPQVT